MQYNITLYRSNDRAVLQSITIEPYDLGIFSTQVNINGTSDEDYLNATKLNLFPEAVDGDQYKIVISEIDGAEVHLYPNIATLDTIRAISVALINAVIQEKLT